MHIPGWSEFFLMLIKKKVYNTSDLEKGSIDFVVSGSHRKDDIRCNPVQPYSSELRSSDFEEMNKKSVLC